MATQKKSPMARMKDEHKDKETLVDRLVDLADRGDEEKDQFKARMLGISNKKLLRLLDSLVEIKQKLGGKDKVVEAIASAVKKAKDKDYVAKLAKLTPPRLIALYRTVTAKAKSSAKKAAG